MVMPFLVNQLLNSAINLLLPSVAQHSLNKGRGQRGFLDRACYCCCAFISCITGQDRVMHFLGRADELPSKGKAVVEQPRGGSGGNADRDGGNSGGGGGGGQQLEVEPISDTVLERVLLELSRPAFAFTDQYVVIVLNFCWVCFFSIIFPWGPACALLNNVRMLSSFALYLPLPPLISPLARARQLVQLRADTFRMVKVSTRPVPRQVDGIGTWRHVLGFVVAMSVFVNMAIYILPLDGLQYWTKEKNVNSTEKMLASVLCLVVFDRVGVLVSRLVKWLVPKVDDALVVVMEDKRLAFKAHYLDKLSQGKAHESAVPAALREHHERVQRSSTSSPMVQRNSAVAVFKNGESQLSII